MIDKGSQAREAPGAKVGAEAQAREIRLRLYVANATPNSERARVNLQAALQARPASAGHHVEIIDVLADGRRALTDNVVVTPTLIALVPKRRLVMVGDLSDRAKLTGFLESAASDS